LRCDSCFREMAHAWARDDEGEKCRDCWEAKYPCEETPNYVKIPRRLGGILGWTFTTPKATVVVRPGDYELGYVDVSRDFATIWAYFDEVRVFEKNLNYFIPQYLYLDVKNKLWNCAASREDGYHPILTVYSLLMRHSIFYRKEYSCV